MSVNVPSAGTIAFAGPYQQLKWYATANPVTANGDGYSLTFTAVGILHAFIHACLGSRAGDRRGGGPSIRSR